MRRFGSPRSYDAIFCRNVLMYFTPEQMRAVIARIAQSLAPGGFLFLGHAETLRGVSDRFHLRHTHGTFYYQLKDSASPATSGWCGPCRGSPPAAAVLERHFLGRRHTSRQRARCSACPLAGSRRNDAAAIPIAVRPHVGVWNSCAKERFAEALDHVRAGPQAAEAIQTFCCSRRRCSLMAGSSRQRTKSLPAAAVDRRAQRRSALRAGAVPRAATDRDRAVEHYRVAPTSIRVCHAAAASGPTGAPRRRRDGARRELAQALLCSSARTLRGCCCSAAASIARP